MARQRFIWPEIWKDPVFGRLTAEEQVMFIGLFSIADDEGRLYGDPAFLRSELYTYKDYPARKVRAIRDSLVGKCRGVHLYEHEGHEYVALLKWRDYQKPKYPKPSKLPPPLAEASPNVSGSLPETGATGRDGLGWVGLDRDGPCVEPPTPVEAADGKATVFNFGKEVREYLEKLEKGAA